MNVERKTGTYTADVVSVGEFETYQSFSESRTACRKTGRL
jgi:hypothetical protein